MRVGEIESGVPFTLRGRKRPVYTKMFEQMGIGDSFKLEGTEEEIKAFRSALRSRNLRYKEAHGEKAPRFDWCYESASTIRVWRLK